jgi:hypothetical protein
LHVLATGDVAPNGERFSADCSIATTVSRLCSLERSTATTLAPSRANAMAAARPMPLPAPVTKATLPVNRPFVVMVCS